MSAQQHSSFPPSRMDRVIACPGSYALEKSVQKRETFFTDEGHVAHELAQWALTDSKFDTRAYLGQTVEKEFGSYTIDEKMCAEVQKYVTAVKDRVEAFKKQKNVRQVTLHVEKRIDTSTVIGLPRQSGMADTLIVVEYKDGTAALSVEDLKYGAHKQVEAANNVQLMIYGAGAMSMYPELKVKKVDLVIHMPRLGGTSICSIAVKKLNAFSVTTKNAVSEALAQEKIYQDTKDPGKLLLNADPQKHCLFCRAKKANICPAFNAAAKKKSNPQQSPVPRKKRGPSHS